MKINLIHYIDITKKKKIVIISVDTKLQLIKFNAFHKKLSAN